MGTKGGQKGNKNASADAALNPFKSALNRSIAQNPKKVMAATMALLDQAAAGEQWAVKELADRLDGKATQAIMANLTGSLTVEVVRFADTSPG